MVSSNPGKRAVNAKVLTIAIIVVAVASVGLLALATNDSHAFSGSGTEGDPYILSTNSDLAYLSMYPTGYFELDSNITVTGAWTPVGTSGTPFQGHLNGNGHTITLGTVTQAQYTGFFGYLLNADIENLQIILGSNIAPVTNTTPIYVGGLAGYIDSSNIYNVSIQGGGVNVNLSGTTQIYAGGLAGYVQNSTVNYAMCKAAVTISGSVNGPNSNPYSYMGGLIGCGIGNTIYASLSKGDVNVTVSKTEVFTGGFIGYTDGGTINSCGETGNVTASNDFPANGMYARVGGFAGYSNTPLTDVYSQGNVYYAVSKPNAQGGYVGGLVGESESTINNAYSTGTIGTNLAPDKGGFFGGYLLGLGSATNSFVDTGYGMSPPANNTAGASLTDPQMMNINSFGPTWKAGQWIWNGSYPDLSAFTFIINVAISPSSSYGTVMYSLNSPVTEASSLYSGPLTGNPWDTYYFQAMAASGKIFLRWGGGDDPSILNTTTYVTVPVSTTPGPLGSRTVTAYFEDPANAALLTVNSVPTGAGTFTFTYQKDDISGTQAYTGPQYFELGTTVTVTAAPTGAYSFAFWAVTDAWANSALTGPIELQVNTTLNAVFTLATDPTLTLTASPSNSGGFTFEIQGPSMSWIGPINYNGPVKIPSGFNVRATAVANTDSGYLFIIASPGGWSGAGTTDAQSRRVVTGMTADTTITATFTRGAIVTATAVPGGGGTFTFSTDGTTYNQYTGNKITVPIGSQLWVSASAGTGYTFGFWTGRAVGVSQISLYPTGDTDLSAYFYETNNSVGVTTTVIGEGYVTVTVMGVPAQAQTAGTGVIRVTVGDDVTMTATDGIGNFMFYIGTVTTDDRVIDIPGIDTDYTETAYFTNGVPTADLNINVVGSGYAVVQVAGWPGTIDTRAFGGGPIHAIKVQVGGSVTVTAYNDGGFFQDSTITDTNGTTYVFTPSFTRTISIDTDVTLYFTDTTDVYTLSISASSGNWITYTIGDGRPQIIYSSGDDYLLYVDNTKDTLIGYVEGTGYFQHFIVDRENAATAYSLAGPTALFSDHQNHSVRAIFTDNMTNIYTLTINVHGAGSIGLVMGADPPEAVVSIAGETTQRITRTDTYKGFNISYTSGMLQYAVWTLGGVNPVYDFGNGISVTASVAQPLTAGAQYVVDVYFLDGDTADYTLSMSVVGGGTMTFNIGNGPVPLTPLSGTVRIPLLSADQAAIAAIDGPGEFQYYTNIYGAAPATTDVILTPTMTITSANGDQAVTAHFTATGTSNILTLGTYGSGHVTFTTGGVTGNYQSPTPGARLEFPIDIGDVIQIGYVEEIGSFQFYIINGTVQFTSPQTVTGAISSVVIAYFTNTADTYNLTIGVAGSGTIYAEIFDGSMEYTSVLIGYSNTTQTRVIPLDLYDTVDISATEINGHFQYFTVGATSPVVVQGTTLGPGSYGYPDVISDETTIIALFTDNQADDYQLVLNVSPVDKGTITYQIGGDPTVSFRGDTTPRTLWVDPYESTTIGYDDSGSNDGYFQYFVYEKNGANAESMFSIPIFNGVGGDTYVITAKFTNDKTNVVELSLATTGEGYITFKHGSDPMGRYNSPVDEEPKILYLNNDDPASTIVNMEEYDISNPQYVGYSVDGGSVIDAPMPDLTFTTASDHSVVVYFNESGLVYTLQVNVYGSGTASVLDGAETPVEESASVFTVHSYRDVTITAANVNGLFQGMRMTSDGGSTYTWWQTQLYTIPSGTSVSGGVVTVDVYFTSSDNVYYLSLYSEAGGSITYNIDNTGDRAVSYQQLGIPIDLTSRVDIGHIDGAGKFQYFISTVSGSSTTNYNDGFQIPADSVQKDASVSVAAYFTVTNNTYDLVVGTVGDGYITFTEGRAERQTQVAQGGPYTIPIDVGTQVTVGWQEINPSVPRFQYFEYTDNASVVTLQRPGTGAQLQIMGVSGGVYQAIAFFTSGPQYTVSISTNITAGAAIGLQINMADPPLWYTGQAPISIPVDLSMDVKVTYQIGSATLEFEFFVLNNTVTFTNDPFLDIPDAVSPTANSVVNVIAYFADQTGYTVNLSTVGSGSITYTIDGYNMGSFNSEATPGQTSLEFMLNNTTSLTIGNTPAPGTAFMYYIYTLNTNPPSIMTGAPTIATSSYNGIVARFTGTDYYTLTLSANGGGAITYQIGSDPMGTYAGFTGMLLNVSVGTDVNISYDKASINSFRWFIQTIGGASTVTRSDPLIPTQVNQAIQAVFIANPYFVTLGTVGGGDVTITIGLYTYTYHSENPGETDSIPIVPGTQADINYIEDTGYFQQFEYSLNGLTPQSSSAPFSIIGQASADEYVVTAYFTSGPTYSIDLSRLGGGQITFKIDSRTPVSISNAPASPFRLYVDETDEVVIGNAPGLFAFQYYNYTGGLFSQGPLTDLQLTFPTGTTGSHAVTAVFTNTLSTYTVTLGTVGGGYITFNLSTMTAGTYAKYQSPTPGATYSLTIDSTGSVTVGYEEGDGYFIGFVQGTQSTLSTSSTISVDVNTTSANRAIQAYFTDDKTNVYSLNLSTIGNGSITYEYQDLGVTGQYRSPTAGAARTVYANLDEELIVGHSNNPGEYFNVFIVDGGVVSEDTIDYSPSSPETHDVTAVFTTTSNVREILLATTGSGYITYQVPGVVPVMYGSFQSYPGLESWPIYVDTSSTLSIGNDPDNSYFQYYVIAIGANAPTISAGDTYVVPVGTTGARVTANFTADTTNVYALTLSTVGNGYITFSLDGGPTGQFMSSSATPTFILHVDNGVNTSIDRFVSGSTGRFQFFVNNGTLTAVSPFTVSADSTITAYFTNTRNTYTLTLTPVGGGHIEFMVGVSSVYTTAISITFPVDSGTSVPVSAVADLGAFRFIVYDGATSVLDTSTVTETGGTHLLTAYFTTDLSTTTYLTVGKIGVGQVNVRIVTGGVTIPTIVNFTGVIPMEQADTVTLNAIETTATDKFTNWTSGDTTVNGYVMPAVTFGTADNVWVTANFSPLAGVWKLTITATEGGSASFVSGILWGSVDEYITQDFYIPRGTQVDLTASVSAGYVFGAWASNDPNASVASPEVSFTIAGDTTATALFYSPDDVYTLTLSAGTGGSASIGYYSGTMLVTGPVAAGATEDFFVPMNVSVDLTAFADTGYGFVQWTSSDPNVDNIANSKTTFTIAENTTAAAVFDDMNNVWMLTLSATTGGTASFSYDLVQGSIAANETQIFFIPRGSDVDFAAVPSSATYSFVHWLGDAAGEHDTFSTTLSSNYSATAAFLAAGTSSRTLYITATSDGNSSISPSGTSIVPAGGSRTFTFSANEGYQISAVYVDGSKLSPEQIALGSYTFMNVQSSHTIDVVTAQRSFILIVDVVGGNGTPEYRFNLSDQYTRFLRSEQVALPSDIPGLYVSITVDNGYQFVGWTGDVVSNDITLQFSNPDQDIHLVAHLSSEAGGEWAVVNLIFAVLAVLVGAIAVIAGRDRWKRDKEELSRATILRFAALAVGLVSLVIFFATENLSLAMGWVDKWTPVAAGLFVVVLIIAALSYFWRHEKD